MMLQPKFQNFFEKAFICPLFRTYFMIELERRSRFLREKVQYFHADYRDGRVHIGGKIYQAGIFATHLLNQYYKDDTAARLAVYKRYNWHTAETLKAGYLNKEDFIKAGEEILLILQTLPKLQPFAMLDTIAERERIAELFTENNADIICDYFNRKAAVHNMTEADRALDLLPKEYNKDLFTETECLINDVTDTLCFSTLSAKICELLLKKCKNLLHAPMKRSVLTRNIYYP